MSRYEESSELREKRPQWLIAGIGVILVIVGLIIYGISPEKQVLVLALVLTGLAIIIVGLFLPRLTKYLQEKIRKKTKKE